MVLCPFHDDHRPSLKLNADYYYCFGCGEHGDVISLTAKLLGLRPYGAACRLAADFRMDVDAPGPQDRQKNASCCDLLFCQRVLKTYLVLLLRWKNRYHPTVEDEVPDERYVEACQMLDWTECLVTVLTADTLEQREDAAAHLMADGRMKRLMERLNRLVQEEVSDGQE